MTEPKHPIRDTFLPYGKQMIDEDDIEAVIQVLRSPYITQGPAIDKFERAIAEYSGAKYAVAFSNGTAALHGACYAAGIGPGDEVITTPITFLASSNCVLYCGGAPVFADIRSDTYNIDPDGAAKKITQRTKAIIAVDFSGQPTETDRLSTLAHDHGLVLIQDAAHSLGATYADRRVGSLADMTMFSFHPVKHITTGEGGVIVTDNEQYRDRLLMFRSHGMTRDPELLERNDGPWYYEMHELGYNYRMTDIQAALGASQVHKLDRLIQRRREIAEAYDRAFSNIPGLTIPYQLPQADSSWHLYVVRWDEGLVMGGRDRAFELLRSMNIGVHVHYIPIYRQPYYRKLGYDREEYPNAEHFYRTAMTLPLFPQMSDQDVEDVIQSVLQVAQQLRSGM
ncbi:UDP-4-amino-4,6-dideoxy-N-acetyl-beta-L-altrosamine transaminase [Cohnella cholangitidis]|uniref:UDP-4-amino-4, 6-dideoxy-N-acetyl-beta-L-altrosamine transaminase n=1 Tax=Cohnella cholangitidis TaxID=2598458 RepID=A0A7G5BXH0_9BACL|nr:UDP-4-amino-4,6-dideoxy-N-acetyl-beta-L-altrosamine transaminase [Cohnella cholangitidis]QMV41654.1 UDP-4-amino-4,6-dideoxy-N-acetyl-beta-L-altrosamine transaminase [Cohnella cholangitidis]